LLTGCDAEEAAVEDPPLPRPPASAPATFTVGGITRGLPGTGLLLQDNAGDDLAVAANGGFMFSRKRAISGRRDLADVRIDGLFSTHSAGTETT
jgi:hypothetical protein